MDNDQKLDQFLLKNMKQVKLAPKDEWSSIHEKLSAQKDTEASWFSKFWLSTLTTCCSLTFIVYSFSQYNVDEVDVLVQLSAKSISSWNSSAGLISATEDFSLME